MENNIQNSILIKFNNITENIKLTKDFDEFKNDLNEKFKIKEEDFEKFLLYYIDEDNDKISIQNFSDYSQFFKDCKNNNETNILYIKEIEENNTNNNQNLNINNEKLNNQIINNNNQNININNEKNINNNNENNTNKKEEKKDLSFEEKYKCKLLCINCNSNIKIEPFYYCPKCKEYCCSNCDEFISSHRHVAFIIHNTNQYSDLIDSINNINNKNKKKKKKIKISNVFEKISNIIFSEKSDAEKIKMCKKIYNLDGVSDEKILDALNKSNGNPEKIIEYLF